MVEPSRLEGRRLEIPFVLCSDVEENLRGCNEQKRASDSGFVFVKAQGDLV